MGGDATLHHLGNCAHVNYISRAFRASRHSEFYIDEASLNYETMFLQSQLNAEEVFQDEIILAFSRHGQGRRLDPVSALHQAENIFHSSGALPPPDNAVFRLVWFTGRD